MPKSEFHCTGYKVEYATSTSDIPIDTIMLSVSSGYYGDGVVFLALNDFIAHRLLEQYFEISQKYIADINIPHNNVLHEIVEKI